MEYRRLVRSRTRIRTPPGCCSVSGVDDDPVIVTSTPSGKRGIGGVVAVPLKNIDRLDSGVWGERAGRVIGSERQEYELAVGRHRTRGQGGRVGKACLIVVGGLATGNRGEAWSRSLHL